MATFYSIRQATTLHREGEGVKRGEGVTIKAVSLFNVYFFKDYARFKESVLTILQLFVISLESNPQFFFQPIQVAEIDCLLLVCFIFAIYKYIYCSVLQNRKTKSLVALNCLYCNKNRCYEIKWLKSQSSQARYMY